MKASLKVLSYFILEFILSLLVLGCVGLFLIKSTVYSSEFLKEQFKKSDYYNNLYTSINDEMSNIVVQAGFDESTLENIYTKDMLIEVIDEMIDGIYTGKTISISTDEVKENLNKNINNYLEKNNIKITDQEALDKFINNILKIYTDEITVSDNIKKVEKIVTKTNKLVNIGFIICVVGAIALGIFIKLAYKDTTLSLPFITSGIILIFGYLLVTSNINIGNIFIWDVKVSELLKQVMINILGRVNLYGIVLTTLGCVDALGIHYVNNFRK